MTNAAPSTPQVTPPEPALELIEILIKEEAHITEIRQKLEKNPSDFLPKGQGNSPANSKPAPSTNGNGQASLDPRIQNFREMRSNTPRGALCFSGGGIRSACISLGVMQGLARLKKLSTFDYLSTVSGGGYIGCWLSTLVYSERRPNPPEAKEPKDYGSVDQLIEDKLSKTTYGKEAEEITNLRVNSNYLTPRAGGLSTDLFTCLMIVARNMIVNWLVLIPFFALCLTLPVVVLLTASAAIDYLRPVPDLAGWTAVVLMLANGALAAWLLPRKLAHPVEPMSGDYELLLKLRWGINLAAALALAIWLKTALSVPNKDDFLLSITFAPVYGIILVPYCFGFGRSLYNQSGNSMGPKFVLAIKAACGFLLASFISYVAARGLISLLHPPPESITGWFQQISPHFQHTLYLVFAPLAWTLFFIFQNFILVGCLSMISGDLNREWWSRSNAVLLSLALGWFLASLVAIYGPALQILFLLHQGEIIAFLAANLTFGGVFALLASSGKTPATKQDAPAPLRIALLSGGAVVFFLFLALLLACANYHLAAAAADFRRDSATPIPIPSQESTKAEKVKVQYSPEVSELTVSFVPKDPEPQANKEGQSEKEDRTQPGMAGLIYWLGLAGVWGGFTLVASWVVNINQFSIQCLYRNRLVRGFIGAVRRAPGHRDDPSHHFEPFTGFDEDDNYEVAKLKGQLPFHVINMTQNLIKPTNLAWQERRASSFTVSPLHTGGTLTGYRPTCKFGDGISIGTAMATSGAAANPSMGHCSSPTLALLMTLFNVRLGWWVGNPTHPTAWSKIGPTQALRPLLSEMLGLTTEDQPEVLLSDGGHFEDLGVYEMIQRRCRFLIVVDGGADPKGVFEDLGNAVRKVRIDLGVEIDFIFNRTTVELEPTEAERHHFAVAKIKYSDVDGEHVSDGWLLYLKGILTGDEPADLYQYKKFNKDFPHQSTADQWFDESQFESYRALGQHTIDQAIRVISSYQPVVANPLPGMGPCLICGEDVGARNQPDFEAFVKYVTTHLPLPPS